MPKSDGGVSEFADNMKKLKGFGNKNKSSEAELLFQFFRFYAHEFDYDKNVLSVRHGKLITKNEKKWNYAINNQLCVEEPFNTSRNLGNTADEYSFRGLHQELRRAFDLLSNAKLEEACEQYVFPKEEERVWSRPAPQPRPVLLRSSSQTHTGRGGGRGNHRGGRHSNNYRGGGSSRRASSAIPTYDPNMFVQPMGMQQDMSWFQNPHLQIQYAQQDLMTQMAYAQENMRQLHLYAQSPAFLQHQNIGQQRLSVSNGSGQQSADRSRTNSFDNPPISAPLRPDLYAIYGMGLSHPFYTQAATGYGTYPSSPATPNGTGQDFRRPLQRSTVTSDSGVSASSSSLRSQSQPASRSPSSAPRSAGYTLDSQPSTSASMYAPRSANGIPIPSFISDDTDVEDTPRPVSDSPHSEESKSTGYFPPQMSSSPTKPVIPTQQSTQAVQAQSQVPPSNGIAFGDVSGQSSSPGRRRLSTDQLPQTLLDRRMRRASRSPSPLGHSRAFSVGTSSAPLSSAPFPGSQNKNSTRPLVVNGSGLKPSMAASGAARQQSRMEPLHIDDSAPLYYDNALHINMAPPLVPYVTPDSTVSQGFVPGPASHRTVDHPPVIANGSNSVPAPPPADDTSFRERIAMMNSYNANYANYANMTQDFAQNGGAARLSPSARQRLMSRQPQSGVIAPLDLAIGDNRVGKSVVAEMAHLSPVYETRTPSPTTLRKQDSSTTGRHKSETRAESRANKVEAAKQTSKLDESVTASAQNPKSSPKVSSAKVSSAKVPSPKMQKPVVHTQKGNPPRENGHVRSAKSETDGGWQKAGKGKKKANNTTTTEPTANVEQPPKHESERKGG